MEIITGKEKRPWKALLYGVPGIGKSLLANSAPNPIFVNLEDGLKRIDCHKTNVISTWPQLLEALNHIYTKTDYETVVIDTVTALEKIITQKTIAEDKKERATLADWGYGTGYEVLAANFSLFMQQLAKASPEKNILFIGHDKIERYEDPTNEGYDRYSLQVHKKIAPVLIANLDAVLFAQYESYVRTTEKSDRTIGVGTGKRMLHTVERPAFVAKNRYSLPETLEIKTVLGTNGLPDIEATTKANAYIFQSFN